jgi:hypothetical protein
MRRPNLLCALRGGADERRGHALECVPASPRLDGRGRARRHRVPATGRCVRPRRTPRQLHGQHERRRFVARRLPANWNGTLLLYSHGYGTTDPSDAPDDDTKATLLAHGYALAGSGLGPPSGTVPDVRHRCTSATLGSGDGTSSLEQLLRHRHIEFPCEGHRA